LKKCKLKKTTTYNVEKYRSFTETTTKYLHYHLVIIQMGDKHYYQPSIVGVTEIIIYRNNMLCADTKFAS